MDVNGVAGDTNAMLQECKVQPRLILTVIRDSCNAAAGWDMSRMCQSSRASGSDMFDAGSPLPMDEAAVARSGAATDGEVAGAGENTVVVSPLAPKQLRPDAQVFVPSAQKEPSVSRTTPTSSLTVPPGLGGYDMGSHVSLSAGLAGASPSSLLATAPPPQMQFVSTQGADPLQVLGLQAVCEHSAFDEAGTQQQDVKRALFS